MGELSEGERLLGRDGPVTILSHEVLHRPTSVYNIEVHGEHVYQVGHHAVLVHNSYADAAKRGRVNAADEVFEQALRNGPETVGGFKIYGNKGLVGDSYARNIFLIEAERKGASSLRGLVNTLEAEARAAAARELRIIGHAVFNEGFLNPRIAQRFGFILRRINDETIELVKIVD